MLASPPFTLGFAAALIWRVSCSCTDYRPPPIHRLRCSLWVEGTGTHAPLLGAREHEAAFCVSVVDTLAEPEFFQRSRDVTLEMLLGGVAKALQPWGWGRRKGVRELETCWARRDEKAGESKVLRCQETGCLVRALLLVHRWLSCFIREKTRGLWSLRTVILSRAPPVPHLNLFTSQGPTSSHHTGVTASPQGLGAGTPLLRYH